MDQPNIAQKHACVLNVQAGTYWWCACGLSKNQPYCDGSHEGTGFSPLEVKIEQDRKVAFCGCKHTATKPFCDGTHKKL
jgi:CDGSH iron-sulfur domain-containing protein 3